MTYYKVVLQMEVFSDANFKLNYPSHLQHLKLKGLQLKTIETYSQANRRIGDLSDNRRFKIPDFIRINTLIVSNRRPLI